MPAPPWSRGRQLARVESTVSESTSVPRSEVTNAAGASAVTWPAPIVTAWVGAVARVAPSAAWSVSVASYAPAVTSGVVPSVSVHVNADVISAPLPRLWRSKDTEAAPTCAHVVGSPSTVIDHEADAEPCATMSGGQRPQPGGLASAGRAEV